MQQQSSNSSSTNICQNEQLSLSSPTKKIPLRSSKSKKGRQRRLNQKRLKKHVYNNSLWTLKQNKAYMMFLTQKDALFALSNIGKRDIKINVLMSKFVQTRSADQCRSHHQKMMKYHNDIPSIIKYIANLVLKEENPSYSQSLDQYEYQLQDLMQIEWPLEQQSFCSILMNQN